MCKYYYCGLAHPKHSQGRVGAFPLLHVHVQPYWSYRLQQFFSPPPIPQNVMYWKWNVISSQWCGPHPLRCERIPKSFEQWLWSLFFPRIVSAGQRLCMTSALLTFKVSPPLKVSVSSWMLSRRWENVHSSYKVRIVAPFSFTHSPSLSPSPSYSVILCEGLLFACQCTTPPHHKLRMVHSEICVVSLVLKAF